MDQPDTAADPAAPMNNPLDLLRTRGYLGLLLFGALIGVPIAAVAYGFLKLVDATQEWVFESLPAPATMDTTGVSLCCCARSRRGRSIVRCPTTEGGRSCKGPSQVVSTVTARPGTGSVSDALSPAHPATGPRP